MAIVNFYLTATCLYKRVIPHRVLGFLLAVFRSPFRRGPPCRSFVVSELFSLNFLWCYACLPLVLEEWKVDLLLFLAWFHISFCWKWKDDYELWIWWYWVKVVMLCFRSSLFSKRNHCIHKRRVVGFIFMWRTFWWVVHEPLFLSLYCNVPNFIFPLCKKKLLWILPSHGQWRWTEFFFCSSHVSL